MKALVLTLWALMALPLLPPSGPAAVAQLRPAPIQGIWRSGDTTLRISVTGAEAKGLFAAVSQEARTLGFTPGDVSFVATVMGNYLYGQQTIKYGDSCHPNGRTVPFIGRLSPNGQALAMHFYNAGLDPNCQDTDQGAVTETLWQRQPDR